MSDSAGSSAASATSAVKKDSALGVQAPTDAQRVERRNAERVSHLLKILRPRGQLRTLLDVGCGNAEITQAVADAFRIKNVYGQDIYPAKEFKRSASNSSVQYIEAADGRLSQLADGSVDLVTCFVSIHHFEDSNLMLQEIARVLRPQGYLFIREHDVPMSNIKLKEELDAIHKQFDDFDHSHPSGRITYWGRDHLRMELEDIYGFQYLASSDYSGKNPQAIYHSLFMKRGPSGASAYDEAGAASRGAASDSRRPIRKGNYNQKAPASHHGHDHGQGSRKKGAPRYVKKGSSKDETE